MGEDTGGEEGGVVVFLSPALLYSDLQSQVVAPDLVLAIIDLQTEPLAKMTQIASRLRCRVGVASIKSLKSRWASTAFFPYCFARVFLISPSIMASVRSTFTRRAARL